MCVYKHMTDTTRDGWSLRCVLTNAFIMGPNGNLTLPGQIGQIIQCIVITQSKRLIISVPRLLRETEGGYLLNATTTTTERLSPNWVSILAQKVPFNVVFCFILIRITS